MAAKKKALIIDDDPAICESVQAILDAAGYATACAFHQPGPGDKIGIRGPFRNGFPFEEIKGKNVVYVAGGR